MVPVTLARDLFDLEGEVALVTGASSGLGARFVEVLAAHGAKVVLAARRIDRLKKLAGRLSGAQPLKLDVGQPQTFGKALAEAESTFGPITILINNAGVVEKGKFLDLDADAWENVRQTNIDAVWHLSQAFAKRLIAAGREGRIINIASILGYRVTPGASAYGVSKAAVIQMTNALAQDLARHRIRVNAMAPGYIMTEMTEAYLNSDAANECRKNIPLRRVGEPADLDGILLLLAARRASPFMTGTTIVADGGHMTTFR